MFGKGSNSIWPNSGAQTNSLSNAFNAIGNAQQPTNSLFGGLGLNSNNQTSTFHDNTQPKAFGSNTSGYIFGQPATTQQATFGSNTTGSLFGQQKPTTGASNSLFGGAGQSNTIFGAGATGQSSGTLFGSANQSNNIFGADKQALWKGGTQTIGGIGQITGNEEATTANFDMSTITHVAYGNRNFCQDEYRWEYYKRNDPSLNTTNTGTTNNLFGTTSNTGTATGGLFGITANTGTTTGGLFGTSSNTGTTTGGLFGSTSNPATGTTTGGLFGTAANTTSTTGGLFGKPNTTGTTNNLFGTTSNTGTTTGGLFGITGNTGTTAGGLFGTTSNTGTTTGGLFGSTPNAGTTTGSSLFGTTSNTGTTTGGLFGSTPNTGTTTNLFGTTANTGTTTGGLFGSTPNTGTTTGSSLFGTTANTGTTTNLFGTTANTGTTTGGLFGSTPNTGTTTGSSLFGTTANTGTTTNLFGTTANTGTTTNLFGTTANTGTTTNLFGNTGTTSSLFGNTLSTNQFQNKVGDLLLRWDISTPAPGLASFWSNQDELPAEAKSYLQNLNSQASNQSGNNVNQTTSSQVPNQSSDPFGLRKVLREIGVQVPRYSLSNLASRSGNESSRQVDRQADAPNDSNKLEKVESINAAFNIPPTSDLLDVSQVYYSNVVHCDTFLALHNGGLKGALGGKSDNQVPRSSPMDDSPIPQHFVPPNGGILLGIINKTEDFNNPDQLPRLDTSPPTQVSRQGSLFHRNGSRCIITEVNSPSENTTIFNMADDVTDSVEETSEVDNRGVEPSKTKKTPILTKNYSTRPTMSSIREMSNDQLANVMDFTIISEEHGSILWPGYTDLRGLNLDEIVEISHRKVKLYEGCEAHPVGKGLNKQAVITLNNCFEEGKEEMWSKVEKVREYTESMGCKFLSANFKTGVWVFESPWFKQ